MANINLMIVACALMTTSIPVIGACLPSDGLICDDTPTIDMSQFSEKIVDTVLINKSKRRMYLLSNGEKIKSYKVALGGNPVGHKVKEGDEKTPEGNYFLDYKKEDSAFYRAIHISYPNDQDVARAAELGVEPGGFIMIHGQRNGLGWVSAVSQFFDWTKGCIAVTNAEMDEIWKLVEVGTPIELKP